MLRTALATLALVALPVAAGAEGLSVELNKLETGEGGVCRAFFLIRNGTDRTFEEAELSLAVLDGDGVIDQLLTLDLAPLPVGRTVLKLFEVPGIDCADISELLVHDVPACRAANAEPEDCFAILSLSSRAGPTLSM